MKITKLNFILFFSLLIFISTGWSYTADENIKIEQFLTQQFKAEVPKPKRLWIKAAMKTDLGQILNRPANKLNYRYWQSHGKTIWLLDEIGKERDITTAVVVKNQQIAEIKVLVYRESRGGEVQIPWFNQQFVGANNHHNWQREIDSISGATLSVNAMKKQAELALYLNQQLTDQQP